MTDFEREKRYNRKWDGENWIEHFYPTSADLVYMDDEGTTLETKMEEVEGAIAAGVQQASQALTMHNSDNTRHKTANDRLRLSNLPDNANDTFATKDELRELAEDENLQKTELDNTKLANLPENANATFATKAEVAGEKREYYFADVAAKEAFDMSERPAGDTCWVGNASDDDEVQAPGSAKYMWDGERWNFLFETDANIVVDWDDVQGRPEVTVEELENAVLLRHSHHNGGILYEINADEDGDLTYKGQKINTNYNRVYLGSEPPEEPNVGDMWLPLINQ